MVRTSTKATSSDAPKRHGGRIPGAKAYHKPTLYALVSQFRPINRVMWDAVANQYRVATGELKVRDNVKRYFVQKCCNNNKKPTGQSAPDPFTEKCQQLWRSILESEDASDMGESDGDVQDSQDLDHIIGQETQLTTQVDTQDPDYEDDMYTSDSEEEIVVKSRETPTSTSTMSTTPRINKTVNSNHHNEIGASNKSKNIKHTINQGRQNIGKGITDLLETVKNTSTSSDSSMMMYLSAQDSSRRLEIEDRRREREIEIEERRKDREAERERERERMECIRPT
jgi:hypothetical protein